MDVNIILFQHVNKWKEIYKIIYLLKLENMEEIFMVQVLMLFEKLRIL